MLLGELLDEHFGLLVKRYEGMKVLENAAKNMPYVSLEMVLNRILARLNEFVYSSLGADLVIEIVRSVVRNEVRKTIKDFVEMNFDSLLGHNEGIRLIEATLFYWPLNFTSKIVKSFYGRLILCATSSNKNRCLDIIIRKKILTFEQAFLKEIQRKKAVDSLMSNQKAQTLIIVCLEEFHNKSKQTLVNLLKSGLNSCEKKSIKEFWISVLDKAFK